MSTYPGTVDTFNVIGTTNYMDEAGYVLHTHLNTHGSAVTALERTLGTTAGTSIAKDFTAGEFAIARNSGGTVTDTLTKGTANNFILGTPAITGGTTTNTILGGTLNTTGGTATSPTFAGTPVLDANSAIPFYGDSMARQAVMNGNFDVWQRGVTATAIANDIYLADRWQVLWAVDGGTLPTHINRRTALTPGDINNSFYSYELNVDGAGSGFGDGAYYWMRQKIEHGTRLLCGLDKTVTVSFWAKSDIANKRLGIFLQSAYGTGGTPTAPETINGTNWTLTSTWTKYTYTFTTNTLVGKTFGTGNDDFLTLTFMNMWEDTYKARAASATVETFVGSGSIFIAQVQLCAGEVALPFQPKSFVQELTDCQRYFEKSWDYSVAVGTGSTYVGFNRVVVGTNMVTSNYVSSHWSFNVAKRITPTINIWDYAGTADKITTIDQNTTQTNNVAPSTVNGEMVSTQGFGMAQTANGEAGFGFHWTATAEL